MKPSSKIQKQNKTKTRKRQVQRQKYTQLEEND